MRRSVLALWLCGLAATVAAETTTFMEEKFTDTKLSGWQKVPMAEVAVGEGYNGGNCLKFKVEAGKETNAGMISKPVDVKSLAGRGIILEAMIKGENLTKPEKSYLGPKMMLHLKTPTGDVWQDQRKEYGTYDWKKFTTFLRVPNNAEKINLCLGLQGCSGTLRISDVKITLIPTVAPLDAKPQGDYKQQTRLRGMMSGGALSESDFKDLGQWNVNLMRFQINNPKRQDTSTKEATDRWLDEQMNRIDQVLPYAKKYGINLLLDLHSGPGMKQTELLNNRLNWSNECQALLVHAWQRLATKYKDCPEIWGYDLLNEPREDDYVYQPDGGLDWNRLAEQVAKAIRAIDPVKPIIVEPPIWGSPEGFSVFNPINVSNVVYSVHFYNPGIFSHQGIHGRPAGFNYPGMIEGKKWDKEALRRSLQPVVDFQRKYQVPILVGEFSAVRWAPNDSSARWMRDVIEIFEENGWDWAYHAFREYEGWDAEWSNDRNVKGRQSSTSRKDLLLEYFKRNAPKATPEQK